MSTIVVSVIVQQDEAGANPASVTSTVLVEGQPTETAVALVLAGEVNVAVTSGAKNTSTLQQLASSAGQLASGLRDRAFELLVTALGGLAAQVDELQPLAVDQNSSKSNESIDNTEE